jgi:adenine-specific DNA-methyltransferase
VKTRVQVTAEKLRGGFYTPLPMVRECLQRIRELTGGGGGLRVLEPSVGDGAFLRGLGEPEWRGRVEHVFALEPMEIEAEKARHALTGAKLRGDVVPMSAITWAAEAEELYDVAVGNPPFVRYQFISESDQESILDLGVRLGFGFRGVGNLWIPVLLGALSRLRPGGAFAFVIPTECLTGCSAEAVRRWLLTECGAVRFDLFAPGSFPDVLQEVAILSGRRETTRSGETDLEVVDHGHGGATRRWTYRVDNSGVWTRYLLDPPHLAALEAAQALPDARPLGSLVAFEVSIVTGANDFFAVDEETVTEFGLQPWAVPLLPRARHSPGLIFTEADWQSARAVGAHIWLLDFSARHPDPLRHAGAAAYLRRGKDLDLHERYKCRIREPWYRVPGIVRGDLLLSKRSHAWPRVVVNEAAAFTTDTIYRGRLVSTDRSGEDVAAAFHNSLTLLTVELEGRSFGGGVLELVPSEIGRLTALVPAGARKLLRRLDAVSRKDPEQLVAATDAYLVAAGALPGDLVPVLDEARALLAQRRFDRNSRPAETPDVVSAAAG